MEKWFVAAKKADFAAWGERFGITPITARIIRNRNLLSEEAVDKYLNGGFLDLYPPELMLDMEEAAAILEEQIRGRKKLRVIGDYDVDGITASHILTKGLRSLSACVDTVIPHRIKDGYGLSEQLIEEAAADGIQAIVTCDNGIAASAQIALALEKGMTVVVTDHHEVPYEEKQGIREEILPSAAAVVDPKRAECTYPYPNICGAVVAYKLIELLFRRAGLTPEVKQPLLDEFIQLAAVATVCDVMELLDENRILVKEGLKRLHTAPCMGLRALMEVCGIEHKMLSAYHLGFIIGPCLNATGRLDTAKRALELLDAPDYQSAVTAAGELKEMNESRKAMTLAGVKAAKELVEQESMTQDKVLVLFLPDCHESLAGIIAGRIRETYGKPAIVLTKGEEGIKGSGRSIEGYHMYDALNACKELFTKFGGHKMAAGLSMEGEDAPGRLREALNAGCTLSEEDFIPKVHIDVPLPLSYATEKLAKELELLEPCGTGNPRPLFATKDLRLVSGRKMGSSGSFARYRVEEEGRSYELVYFGNLEKFHAFLEDKYGAGAAEALYLKNCDYRISVVYQLGLHTYKGKTEAQLTMQYFC